MKKKIPVEINLSFFYLRFPVILQLANVLLFIYFLIQNYLCKLK